MSGDTTLRDVRTGSRIPNPPLQRAQADLNRLFTGLRFWPPTEFPLLKLWTSPDVAIIAVPGVAPEDLDVTVRREIVTLCGTRPPERDPVAALQTEINRAFDDFIDLIKAPIPRWPFLASDMRDRDIPVDVAETVEGVMVWAELPGEDETEIDVQVGDSTLIVSGEKDKSRYQ